MVTLNLLIFVVTGMQMTVFCLEITCYRSREHEDYGDFEST